MCDGSAPRPALLERDWLEAPIALDEQLFYNTGIATYVWVLTNRKTKERQGKVQLIDATTFWTPMRKSLGDKRREILHDKAQEILALHRSFPEDGAKHVKLYPTTHFGFRKIRVERPLRLNFHATPERIARLEDERAFQNLAKSKKKKPEQKAKEEAEGRQEQDRIRELLATLPDTLHRNREAFLKDLKAAEKKTGTKLTAPIRKAALSALSERDEEAEICRDKNGNPEPDSDLRDYENVPLGESIDECFAREVAPYVADAWVDETYRDEKDGAIGKVGYDINFNRYFYEYTPPRQLEEIEAEIRELEGRTRYYSVQSRATKIASSGPLVRHTNLS